jgi:SAM-dependent methyltransferase
VISVEQDAFGAALRDCFFEQPLASPLVLEFDNGIVSPALPPNWFLQPESEWDAPERRMLSAVTSGPVLDLGAGAGRHSLLMQERGYEVTAIDVSPGAVEVCRLRGVRDARVADLTQPPADHRWRAVLLMCGNLGLAGGWDETRDLLTRLAQICTDDAVLVADTVDPTETPGERTEGAERDVQRLVVTMRLKYGAVVSPWARLLNVPIVDVEPLVARTGWRLDQHERQDVDHYMILRREGQDTV